MKSAASPRPRRARAAAGVAAGASPLARLLLDPDARRDPYPLYALLRSRPPEIVHRPTRCVGLVTYDDVCAALDRPDLFSSAVMRQADPTLLGADPREHTRARRLITRAFTPSRLASLAPTIQAVCDAAVRRIARSGTADVIAELARPLPLAVLRDMLGVPPEHEAALADGVQVVMAQGGELASVADVGLASRSAALAAFVAALIEARIQRPGTDVVSTLLRPDAGGDALTREEAGHFVRLLFAAAVETTSNLIGNTLLALLQFPRELERVHADPALAQAAVTEALRYDTPVQMLRRRTTAAVTIGGTFIEPGSDALLLIGAAQRDPARFDDPDRFDLSRAGPSSLAFGSGVHACLGARLAQAQAVAAVGAMVTTFRSLRLAEPSAEVPRLFGLHVRGVQRLVVKVGR